MNNTLANYLITIIALVFILIVGKSMIIPFVFALLLWFIVKEIKNILNKVAFIRKKFPAWLKSLITSIFIIGLLSLIVRMLSGSVQELAESYASYEKNLELILNKLNASFNSTLS